MKFEWEDISFWDILSHLFALQVAGPCCAIRLWWLHKSSFLRQQAMSCLPLSIWTWKAIFTISTFMNIFWGSLVSGNGISARGLSVVFFQWGSFIFTHTLGNYHRSGSEKLAESRVHCKEAMLLNTLTEGVICFPAEQKPGVKSTKVGSMYVFTRIARELHKQ